MDDAVTTNHDDLTGLLPDYAVGALDDDESRRVARHLDQCPPCRVRLEQLWELAALFATTTPPSPAVKNRLLARSTAQATTSSNAARPTRGASTRPPTGPPRRRVACPPADRRWVRFRRSRRARLALVAVAAGGLLLVAWAFLP